MVSDANTAADGGRRGGPYCGSSPAELYCSQHDSFLCRGCDVVVRTGCPERQPTAAASGEAAAAAVPPPITSDISGSATVGGATAEALKPSHSLYTAESAPAPPAAAAAAQDDFPSASCCGTNAPPAHASPFAFTGHRGLTPPPPLPRTTADDAAPPPPAAQALPMAKANSLDQELMDCLESLTNDPLAPLDFGFDLARLGGPLGGALAGLVAGLGVAADLEAPLDSSIECVTALEAAVAAALPLCADNRPGSAQRSRSVGDGATRCSPLVEGAAGGAAGGAEVAELHVGGDSVGLSGSNLWRAYRPTGEEQVVVVEERAPPPRKRLPEGGAGAADGDARGAARVKLEGNAEGQQRAVGPASRNWAAGGGASAVVTTGMAAHNAVSALVACLSVQLSAGAGPATPTADAALPPTMGSFIWQQAQPRSPLAAPGAAAAAAAAAPPSPGGAVTTGVAQPAQALAAAAGPRAAGNPAAGKQSRKRDFRRRVAPAAPAAAASPAAAAADGEEAGQHQLPPIPAYREGETRADKLARYRAKRDRRRFKKTVRYECRKHYADLRPRIKGRFVSPEEFAAWNAQQGGEESEGSLPQAPLAVAAY